MVQFDDHEARWRWIHHRLADPTLTDEQRQALLGELDRIEYELGVRWLAEKNRKKSEESP